MPLYDPCEAAQERTLEVPPALTERAAAGLRSPAAGGGVFVLVFGREGAKRRKGVVSVEIHQSFLSFSSSPSFLFLSFLSFFLSPESIAARWTMCVAPLSATAVLGFYFSVGVERGKRREEGVGARRR